MRNMTFKELKRKYKGYDIIEFGQAVKTNNDKIIQGIIETIEKENI